jgi:class 3 adenylate cyclase
MATAGHGRSGTEITIKQSGDVNKEMQSSDTQSPPRILRRLRFANTRLETVFQIQYDRDYLPFYRLSCYLSFVAWFPALIIVYILEPGEFVPMLAGVGTLYAYLTALLYILSLDSWLGRYQLAMSIAACIATANAILLFQYLVDAERPYLALIAILTIQVFCIFLFRLRMQYAVALILFSSALLLLSFIWTQPERAALFISIAALFNFILILVLAAYYFERSARTIFDQRRTIESEHRRSEALLLNVLPRPIADRLKREPGTIADRFETVTILFADLVDFTRLSQKLEPAVLVGVLDKIFTEFDHLAEAAGLEKIKTIGDAYMVVGGVPVPNEEHRHSILDMALSMQELMNGRLAQTLPRVGRKRMKLRIGVASGPAVAGIIGRNKFSYDLWGQSVNTASRMESHGIPGEIQVTEEVYSAMKDSYVFRRRGSIEIKGTGPMNVWLLKKRKQT